jgi:hypothetical protein
LVEDEALETIMRGQSDSVSVSVDELDGRGEVRLNVASGSYDEDDDVQPWNLLGLGHAGGVVVRDVIRRRKVWEGVLGMSIMKQT